MKKFLAIILAAMMLLAVAAPALAEGETFLWDNFDDRVRPGRRRNLPLG